MGRREEFGVRTSANTANKAENANEIEIEGEGEGGVGKERGERKRERLITIDAGGDPTTFEQRGEAFLNPQPFRRPSWPIRAAAEGRKEGGREGGQN